MKKYSKKQILVFVIRVFTAALIAALLWTVIYFIAPVKAVAADSIVALEPSNVTTSADLINYAFDGVSFSGTHYVYMIYKANIAGVCEWRRGTTVISSKSIPYNGQYVVTYWNSRTSENNTYNFRFTSSGNTLVASDFEVAYCIYGVNQSDTLSYATDLCNQLNIGTDYASYVGSYTSNDITEPYGLFAANGAVQFSPNVYMDSNSFLTFNGGAAMNGGVSTYELYINDTLVEPEYLSMSSDADLFREFLLDNPELSITDYYNNNRFSLTLDLLPYAYTDIVVMIRAYSVHEQRALILYAAHIHAYPDESEDTDPPVIPPDPDDTETETDIETELPPSDEPGYSQGYADGFQAAAAQSAVGVIKGGTVRAQFTYTQSVNGVLSNQDLIVDITIPSLYQSRSHVNFKPVWDYWYNFSNGNSLITDLLSVRIQFFFSNYFEYQPNLIYFSGTPAADPTGYIISNVVLFDTQERAYNLRQTRDDSVLYNRIYLDSTSDISEPVYSIRFDILMPRTIEFWLKDYQLSLNVPADVLLFNTASYNAGLAAGEKIGFDKGEIAGSQVVTDKAFAEGKSEGYDEGKLAGIREEQSNEIRQDFKWYDMFFSLFDAQVNVFRSIVNFEIFGVNVAGFVLGLVTIGIIAFIIRKVW